MPHAPARPDATVHLDFHHHESLPGDRETPVRANLSVVERVGRTLFVASDEGAAIEALTAVDERRYGGHRSFPLADFFDLPDGPDGEADVEGLALDGAWLWVAGSHSLARRKPHPDAGADESLERLTTVKREPNRFLLGRIPLADRGDGTLQPVRADGARSAACLKMGRKRNALAKRLRHDEHIGRFIDVPAKENGFDVEGLAVRGGRVFLGLRGPVLRGWACIVELQPVPARPGRLRLGPLRTHGRPYMKHFMDLDGLGIRELTFDGDDLLILAGPTMDLDGPVSLYRWCGALDATTQSIIPRDRLDHVLDLPHGCGFDHAEGICCVPREGRRPWLLTVYDNPGEGRKDKDGPGVTADLFSLPDR